MLKRKLFIFILLIILVTQSCAAAFAESRDGNVYIRSEQLSQMGLLKGVGKGNYDLFRAPTRTEGVIMLIRLLGEEKEAQQYKGAKSPFWDVPEWAEKYISYAYSKGLTKGISGNQFGAAMFVDSNQYMTLLLRALGYSDETGDFTYENPKGLAGDVGLLNDWSEKEKFLRADMILLSYNALFSDLKNTKAPLYRHLMGAGVFSDAQWEKAAALNDLMFIARRDYEWKNSVPVTVAGIGELWGSIRVTLVTVPEEIAMSIPPGKESEYMNYIKEHFGSFYGFAKEFQLFYSSWSGRIAIKPRYTIGHMSLAYLQNPTVPADNDIKDLAMKGFGIFRNELSNKGSDYETAKAIHDYVVNTLEYDMQNKPGSDDIDGALKTGKATCGGYSALFQFFAELSNLEVETVYGTAKNSQGQTENHAWNLVKVDGVWYHVDTTWDDPISPTGESIIRYTYFLLSDDEIAKDHTWNRSFYPAAPRSFN